MVSSWLYKRCIIPTFTHLAPGKKFFLKSTLALSFGFLRSPPAPDLHTLQMLMAANHCESASKNNLIFYDVVWYDESYIQTVNGQQNQ